MRKGRGVGGSSNWWQLLPKGRFYGRKEAGEKPPGKTPREERLKDALRRLTRHPPHHHLFSFSFDPHLMNINQPNQERAVRRNKGQRRPGPTHARAQTTWVSFPPHTTPLRAGSYPTHPGKQDSLYTLMHHVGSGRFVLGAGLTFGRGFWLVRAEASLAS